MTRTVSPSPEQSGELVERTAELISDYFAWRRWGNMAEDKAELREKMREGGYDVNEPTKSDCREAAKAALESAQAEIARLTARVEDALAILSDTSKAAILRVVDARAALKGNQP